MAAIAASAPIPVTSSYEDIQYRRSQTRSFARPAVRRAYATRASPEPITSKDLTADSSDDEDLAPIKLSAEAQAILEDNSQSGSPKGYNANQDPPRRHNGGDIEHMSSDRIQALRQISPSPGRADGSPAPRIVRVASASRPTALSSIARDGSFMYKTVGKAEDRPYRVVADAKTPANRLKKVRVSGSRSASQSPPSTKSAVRAMNDHVPSTGRNDRQDNCHESPEETSPREEHIPVGPSTIARPRRIDENQPHSTARLKRFGAGFGAGPIRRGMIRRQSDEDEAQDQQNREEKSPSPEIQQGRRAEEPDLEDLPDDLGLRSRSPPRKALYHIGLHQARHQPSLILPQQDPRAHKSSSSHRDRPPHSQWLSRRRRLTQIAQHIPQNHQAQN